MSVVVRMKMPKEGCHTCDARCVSALYGYICGIERKNVMPFLGKKNRPDWSPIICQFPKGHGRLIDADAMAKDLEYDCELDARGLDDMTIVGHEREHLQFDKDCKQNCMWYLTEQETIVPAEAERSET